MTLPRISIIMPSFNQAAYLERAILSVLSQGYADLEFMVFDAGSTDGSVEIIHRYQRHLAHWVSQRDRGQTDAINQGILRATGQVIAFLNSDDLYLPGALNAVGAAFSADSTLKWLVGACTQIDARDATVGRFAHAQPRDLASYLMRLSGMLPQPSSFWAVDLFCDHGLFDLDLHYSFDYEFNCRLLARGERPVLSEQALAAFRMHDTSKGGTSPLGFGLERIAIARRYAHCLRWRERLALYRNLGYRERKYAVDATEDKSGAALWARVLRRPWWLLSQQVRQALRPGQFQVRRAA